MKIRQQFVPWWEWEDYINGMWRRLSKEEEEGMSQAAIEFTGDWQKYGKAMGEVLEAWPKTMLHNLSNTSINRRAFLGHCACQYQIQCPEYLVRSAWKELSDKQRFDADEIAEYHIKSWEKSNATKNRTVHKYMAKQMLLQWDT